jgi:hypothetical protein
VTVEINGVLRMWTNLGAVNVGGAWLAVPDDLRRDAYDALGHEVVAYVRDGVLVGIAVQARLPGVAA